MRLLVLLSPLASRWPRPQYCFCSAVTCRRNGGDRPVIRKGGQQMQRMVLLVCSLILLTVGVSAARTSADTLPSGERSFHNATLEPAYNAEHAGQIGYLLTPSKAPVKSNPRAWSPLYVVVYPSSTTVTSTLNCMHVPFENCPSHGDAVAGAAASIV